MTNLSLWRSLDTETYKFFDGHAFPRVVCASTAAVVDGQLRGELVAGNVAALRVFRAFLEAGYTVAFANAAYDLCVAAQADPTLFPVIFRALRERRIHDVLLAEALHAIHGGHLGLMPNGAPLYNPSTGKVTDKYSLSLVTYLTLGRADAKDNDEFRQAYALFDGLDPARWPEKARVYPVDDARNTLEVALVQALGAPASHEWFVLPRIPGASFDTVACRHCGLPRDGAPAACAALPRGAAHKNIQNLPAQVEADFAFKLGAAHSFRVDPDRVEALATDVEEKHRAFVERFREKGWYREDGTENQAAVKRAIAVAYGAKDPCKRCGGSGRIRPMKQVPCRGEKVRGRYRGCQGSSCLCGGRGIVEQEGNEITCKNVFDEDERLVTTGCDGTGFDLDSVPVLPRSDKLGVRTDRDAKGESGDEDLADYGDDEFEKARSTYVPYLRTGTTRPLSFGVDVLKATGRASLEKSPLHQMPRAGHERRCIRARGAWCGYPYETVLGSTDYSAGELCLSGNTRILTDRGYVPIKELVGSKPKVASVFAGEHDFRRAPGFYDAEVFATGEKQVLVVTTVDGRRIEATGSHPFLVQSIIRTKRKRTVDYRWVEAGHLNVGDVLVSGSLDVRRERVSIDPKFYAFGHFVGDGWFCVDSNNRAQIGVCASGDEMFVLENVIPAWEDLVKEAESYIESPYDNRYGNSPLEIKRSDSHFSLGSSEETRESSSGVVHFSITKPHVVRLLRNYGFVPAKAPQKRFPACYWTATYREKVSFIRGLFDADGSVVTSSRRSLSFTAANAELARDYMLALSEFGIDARMTSHYIKKRKRWQTIVQVRGVREMGRMADLVLFVDNRFRSVKAEKLAVTFPRQLQHHENGFRIRSIEVGAVQPVYNLEVPTTRHYVAEGLVVHNCTLAECLFMIFGGSPMRDAINASGDPGILHSELAAEVMGVSLAEFLVRLKAKDKQAVYFRQASKPKNFGGPAGMGSPKIVLTNRKKSAGFTPCEGGPARDEKGREGFHGIRFCVLIGGAKSCGDVKITSWGKKNYPCAPVCKACVEIEANVLSPAYFRRFPDVKEYLKWVTKKTDKKEPAPSLVWDHEAQAPRIIRLRGGCDFSAFANSLFQSMLADIMKAAFCRATRECYLGVDDDGNPSPLAGCRLPLAAHDETISELIADTAHLSGPRIAKIMIEEGYRIAPHVTWRAETALMRFWEKSAEPLYVDGKLVPWERAA